MKAYTLNDLLNLMQKLRDPEKGCVWDKQQTYASIVPHTLEEAYEVAETIEKEDYDALCAELGDLLFQIVFYAQIAQEEGRFDFSHVVHEITSKMIYRHPHVFGDVKVDSVEEQKHLWEKLKQSEKKEEKHSGWLDNINFSMPGMSVAKKMQSRAARIGFDWPDYRGPLDKVSEELQEVREAIETGKTSHIRDEIGDLLFATVNLARHLEIDGEAAIRTTNRRFQLRFQMMEKLMWQDGMSMDDLSLQEMDEYWNRAKQQLKSPN